ncbi:hypothetical protein C4587_02800 [Candidatus Parcubacteria bacterium]|nr:MAG: hypothetical protein C4587_02800 [Candidatus Parcubacteria bacterium]
MKIRTKTLRFIEFFFVGLLMGMAEDLLAVRLVTGETVTFKTAWVVFLVAFPFAIISEYIVDHPKFWETVFRLKKEDREGGT